MIEDFPEKIENENQLDEILSIPHEEVIPMMKRLEGDIIILGIAGKIEISLGLTAINAIKVAKINKKVIGVARFSQSGIREQLEKAGIRTIACDLLDNEAVSKLPQVKNVIFMTALKFGTTGNESSTWAMNVLVPGNVVNHYKNSRIVAFSTGCVYSLVPLHTGGCAERDPVNPLGEYAQSCLGRERVFEYYSKNYKTEVCLLRLNYAIDLWYGVLFDIEKKGSRRKSG